VSQKSENLWIGILAAMTMLAPLVVAFVQGCHYHTAQARVLREQAPTITMPPPVSDRTDLLRRGMGWPDPISFTNHGQTVFEGNKPMVLISLAYLDVMYERQEEILRNQKKILDQQRQILEMRTMQNDR